MPIKRRVRRISPGRVDNFDDHLWPVVLALWVLAAIGFGAIATLLSGPLMWLGLLAIPAMTAVAIATLSRMTNSALRKTMQFAVIVSLAVHLLVLVVASLVLIFTAGTDAQPVAHREVRKIEFSNQSRTVPIPVAKPDNAPEPDVQVRRQPTQVISSEQPLPVPETTATISPQTRRRETVKRSIPRFDDSLSQLRRNRLSRQPLRSIAAKSPSGVAPAIPSAAPSATDNVEASPVASTASRSSAATKPATSGKTRRTDDSRLAKAGGSKSKPLALQPAKPARQPTARAEATPFEAATLSITKKPSRIAGGFDKPNFQPHQDFLAKPASPTAAKINSRPQRSTSDRRRLTSTPVHRDRNESRPPTSVFSVDTKQMANISGSKNPTFETEQAAAELEQPSEMADSLSRRAAPDNEQLDLPDVTDVTEAIIDPQPSITPTQLAQRTSVAGETSQSYVQRVLRDIEFDRAAELDEDDEEQHLLRMLAKLAEAIAAEPNANRADQAPAELEIDEQSALAAADLVTRLSSGGPLSSADLIGQSVTRFAVEATRSLPLVATSRDRADKPESKVDTRALQPIARNISRQPSELAPKISTPAAVAKRAERPSAVEAAFGSAEGIADAELEINRVRDQAVLARDTLAMEVDAIDGPAGLASTPAISAGVDRRPASQRSKQLQLQLQPELETRFRNEDFGGAPAMSPTAKIAKEAFRERTPRTAMRLGEPKTEEAINRGLQFLIRHQQPDGRWSLDRFDREHRLHQYQLNSDTAATALAILAFQGAGYNHLEFKYARQVNHGVRWLVENQADDGLLYLETDADSNSACRLYSHGIAALALSEAYGMTQDPTLKEPAQRALDFIAESQHPSKGGWRYFSEMKRRSSDTSVTGWMVMALQSARLAGLQVEDRTFESLTSWLAAAADPVNESLYRYNPYAVNSHGVSRIKGLNATPSMTAVGLLMRVYTGWERDDPRLVSGANFLIDQQMPGETSALRDTYYWYYATQVLKHVGGSQWKKWNASLRPLLIRTQEKSGDHAGSWAPYDPVPDRWAPFGGRLYVTTMNLLSLEVRHRLLPLHKKTNPLTSETSPEILPETSPIIIVDGPVE